MNWEHKLFVWQRPKKIAYLHVNKEKHNAWLYKKLLQYISTAQTIWDPSTQELFIYHVREQRNCKICERLVSIVPNIMTRSKNAPTSKNW